MTAYYNEHDSYAAEWLRNLIKAGHIAPGDVDERSIVDVRADDLRSYTQCHFFAGIGGWSLGLRLAGWPDHRPVWTGSCPCQPFSAAGAGKAADDERHLWPAWFPLIAERRPASVFGEQVEAAVGWGWLDAVFADLEDEGYACGAAVLPACSVGAPHIRQRLWFVADAGHREGPPSFARTDRTAPSGGQKDDHPIECRGGSSELVNAERSKCRSWRIFEPGSLGAQVRESATPAKPSRTGWADLDWLPCTDGKARPVEPGTFPLAHGVPGRVGRLRAYGNAIVPQVAAEFIRAAMTEER